MATNLNSQINDNSDIGADGDLPGVVRGYAEIAAYLGFNSGSSVRTRIKRGDLRLARAIRSHDRKNHDDGRPRGRRHVYAMAADLEDYLSNGETLA